MKPLAVYRADMKAVVDRRSGGHLLMSLSTAEVLTQAGVLAGGRGDDGGAAERHLGHLAGAGRQLSQDGRRCRSARRGWTGRGRWPIWGSMRSRFTTIWRMTA